MPASALSGFDMESLVTVMEDGMQSAMPVMGTDAAALIEYGTGLGAGVE